MVGPFGQQVDLAHRPGQLAQGLVDQVFGHLLDLDQAGVDADGTGARQAQLDAVVLRRVVRRREHGPGGVEAPGSEIQEVGRAHAQIGDVDALGAHALAEGRGEFDP